jgi:hypothetical protein
MNNYTFDDNNTVPYDRSAMSANDVDESWALALLNEALEGGVTPAQEDKDQASQREKDIITVCEPSHENLSHAEEFTPSAIQIQQMAFEELKESEARSKGKAKVKSMTWFAGLRGIFSKD